MHSKAILTVVVFVACGIASTQAQQQATASTDEQAIRKNLDNYCDAFNRGDVDAVIAYWADDANYVDDQGNAHRGHQAIAALFKDSSENLQGYKLGLEIQTLRLVDPEVALEDGVATLTGPDGDASSGRYTAVWVKSGDRWLVKSAHELPGSADADSPRNADYLKPLGWLVGDWKSEDGGPSVDLKCRWALDKNFVVQEYTVAGRDGNDLQVSQWIGFDPETGQIKSWTFDSLGGHGEALWTARETPGKPRRRGYFPGDASARRSTPFALSTTPTWSGVPLGATLRDSPCRTQR